MPPSPPPCGSILYLSTDSLFICLSELSLCLCRVTGHVISRVWRVLASFRVLTLLAQGQLNIRSRIFIALAVYNVLTIHETSI